MRLTIGVGSTRDVDGQMLLAILAKELGLKKQAKSHIDTARGADRVGTAEERLLYFFGKVR